MTIPQGKLLLVASTGGHLAQIRQLADVIGASDDSVWMTFDNAQSRSLLEGRRRVTVPYIAPRDWRGVLRAVKPIRNILRREEFDGVISTGASIAVPALVAGTLKRIPCAYIESVSRVDGPSMSGRILQHLPGVACYTQHQSWAGGRWNYEVSLFDRFSAKAARPFRNDREGRPLRIFVTLGTISPYRFDSLVDRISQVCAGQSVEVVWQLGCTTRTDVCGSSYAELSSGDFDAYVDWADVVVSHSGVGTCLRLLELGVKPLLVPRLRSRGEHVDDHQLQIARDLEQRGLVSCRDAERLQFEDLLDLAAPKVGG